MAGGGWSHQRLCTIDVNIWNGFSAVIQQLAKDEQLSFPKAEEVLMNEMYADDFFSGGHTIEEAEDKRSQVSGAFKSARMELFRNLLLSLPSEYHCSRTLLSWDTTDPIKALGMY